MTEAVWNLDHTEPLWTDLLFLATKTYFLHTGKTIPYNVVAFLKENTFFLFSPMWNQSLPHELSVHHYSQNFQDSRTRHRHWVPPCLRLRRENIHVVITDLITHMDKKTRSLVLLPSKWGWEPSFCQVHCMRGGWGSATLQDWGIPSKKHLPHLPASMSYIQQGTGKRVCTYLSVALVQLCYFTLIHLVDTRLSRCPVPPSTIIYLLW